MNFGHYYSQSLTNESKIKLSILAIYSMTILTNYDSGCVCFIHMSRQLQKQKLEQRGETFVRSR